LRTSVWQQKKNIFSATPTNASTLEGGIHLMFVAVVS